MVIGVVNMAPDSKIEKTKVQWPWLRSLILLAWLLVACNTPPTPTPVTTVIADGPGNAPVTPTPAPTGAPEPTPPTELTGQIVLWHSWAGVDGDALAQILAAFQQAQPNLTVATLFVADNDLPQSYADAVLAGGGPDVLLAPTWWLSEMVAAGVVQPLGELVTEEEQAAYWPATLENLRRNGRLYGLPTHFELVSLFYNRALVTPDALPTTSEQWLAQAQANPQQGGGLYASLYHLYWGFAGYGATLFDPSGRVVLDQNTGAADFLTWLVAMSKTPGVFVDPDYGMLLERFKKGEYAFFVDGPWAIADLRGALGNDLGVTALPAGSVALAQPWLSADGVFLNPASSPEQQRRALAFAHFFTSAASGEQLARLAHRLPANRAANLGDDPILQGFMQQAATAQAMPSRPEMNDHLWGYGGDMIIKVLNGVGDPALVVLETATLINEANGK
jgi:maltose-binding protein MalE